MDRRWLSLAALGLASCCCRPCGFSGPCRPCDERAAASVARPYAGPIDEYLAPSNYVPPKIADFEPTPMGLEPPDLPPPGTKPPGVVRERWPSWIAAELDTIRATRDPAEQRARIVALRTKAEDAFFEIEPGTLAALAPDILRVYDLSATINEGGDYPEDGIGLIAADGTGQAAKAVPRGPQSRLDRIAAGVRKEVGEEAWSPSETLLEGRGRSLIVLQASGAFVDIEHALDRLATTGGGVVRLRVDVLRDADDFAKGLGVEPGNGEAHTLEQVEAGTAWSAQPVAPSAVSNEAVLAPLRVDSFALDVPHGRRIGARRSTSVAYLQDFDVEVGSFAQPPEPVVGMIRDGVALTAGLDLDRGASGQLDLDLRWAKLARPIPLFSTSLASTEAPVTIELPEVQSVRFHGPIAAPVGGAAYLLRPMSNGLSALLRVEPAKGHVSPLRPGWKRAAPGPASPPEPLPIVTVEFRFENAAKVRITASRISVFTGQRATVQVMNQTAYIAGFDVESSKSVPAPSGEASTIANPVIKQVADGLALDLSVSPSEGDARVFDIRVAASQLDRPIRTMDFPLGKTLGKIQLPTSHDVVLPFRVRLAPGEEKALPPVSVGTKDGPQDVTVWIRYVKQEAVR